MEAFQQQQRALFRASGLTPLKYLILKWLSKDHEANMSTLAALLGVRPQTVTPIVDSLEQAGWVRRTQSRTDRRKSILVLTPRGTRLLEGIRATYFEKLGRALDEAPAPSLRASVDVLASATATLTRSQARTKMPLSPSRPRTPRRRDEVR
ncbi:MAG: MarR family winged helix-turn-helix transcriptional regulator [Thermoplasmata archaeon]